MLMKKEEKKANDKQQQKGHFNRYKQYMHVRRRCMHYIIINRPRKIKHTVKIKTHRLHVVDHLHPLLHHNTTKKLKDNLYGSLTQCLKCLPELLQVHNKLLSFAAIGNESLSPPLYH